MTIVQFAIDAYQTFLGAVAIGVLSLMVKTAFEMWQEGKL